MLRKNAGGRPFPIKCTADIVKLEHNYKPNAWIFCCPDIFEVFDLSIFAEPDSNEVKA